MRKKEVQKPPEIAPEPAPQITPEMIEATVKTLESEGLIHYMSGGAYVPTEAGWKLLMEVKPVKEEIIAYGHPNIRATHTTTFEITKAEKITKDADCIIAVKANKACTDLSKEFKDALKEAKKVEITIEAEGVKENVLAYGSPALKLTNDEEIVIRKSDFIDDRTLAILANKSASELKQELIEKLRKPETQVKITLEIKPY
jgi:hypothetical protein